MPRVEQPETTAGSIQNSRHPGKVALVVAVLALALGLRVWGIGFGLPYDLTYDEPHEIIRALKLGAGEYYWEKSGKGGLYYLLFLEYGALYAVQRTLGWVNSAQAFALSFVQDPSAFYLLGRLTVAFLGALTCLVIFLVGQRTADWRVGIGAALIGATAYTHAVHSHLINVDVGMTLVLWASIWAYLVYEDKRELRWLIGAGICAGLAIAHKRPGGIVLLPLLLAIGCRPERWQFPRQMLKEMGIVVSTMLVTFTVVAPEWTLDVGWLQRIPFRSLGGAEVTAGLQGGDFTDEVMLLTTRPGREWVAWFRLLFQEHNIALTVTALIGAGLGVFSKRRWDIIWAVLVVVFLVVLAVTDRQKPEYYLLPIMPALWLLSSQAIITLAGQRSWVMAAGLLCVIALPLVALVRQDYEWTQPDTRVVAKQWIEANIPSGAKILIDGMQYRFVPSPPLTPNETAVARRVEQAGQQRLSRGVSKQALSLYEQAMQQSRGPTYDLHSTKWGLAIEDPTYYVENCFDYVITSSSVSNRYTHELERERFPQSAQFYQRLSTDPRFDKVYSIAPIPWKRSGPTISVYRVAQTCQTARAGGIPRG